MDSNFQFLAARPSNPSRETGLPSRKRGRICSGTEGSNPSPSSGESSANLTFTAEVGRRTCGLIYTHNGGRFMVSKPIDGKPRCQPVDLLDLLRPRLGGNRSSNLIAGGEHAFEGEERTSQNPKDC